MSLELARAHILAQERLRKLITRAVVRTWGELPGYDERDVDQFLEQVIPVVLAGQRHAVTLTDAYLAQALERPAIGVDPAELIGAGVRNGTTPEQEWRRPFVTVWTALGNGTQWEDAVRAGGARAQGMAGADVQLSMRGTLRAIGEADDRIVGYRRVTDGKACSFCKLVSGQRYTTDQLMPIHNHCGCGVDVITEATRGDFSGNRENDLSVTRDGMTAAVQEHGELGPVLVNGDHTFTHF